MPAPEGAPESEPETAPKELSTSNAPIPIPTAPPGVLEKPKEVIAPESDTKESDAKLKAVEELKAALQLAAAKPKILRQEEWELTTFCMCIKSLSMASETDPVLKSLYEDLPKLGERCFVPLLGIKRPQKKIVVEDKPKVKGRVKTYNTKKGFGFIDMPGFGRDIFVYNSHLIGRIGLMAGESVEFELVMDQSRPQARQVKVISQPQNQVSEIPVALQQLPMGGMVSAPPSAASQMLNMNPLGAMKQAMATTQPNSHEEALAMAAAASEVPTLPPKRTGTGGELETETASPEKAPQVSGEDLFQKIRDAQTAAASDKRKPMPKRSEVSAFTSYPEPPGNFIDQHIPPAGKGAFAALARGADQMMDSEAKFTDEGNIPRNASVRVVNFPASEVNDCLGVVQGYDAATARYSVAVDMRKGNALGASGETVPLQLKEEYLQVESLPPEARRRNMPQAQAIAQAAVAARSAIPPLPGGNAQSEALRKSASEALKRFSDSNANAGMPPGDRGQWPGAPQAMQQSMAMPGMPNMGGKGYQRPPFFPPNPGAGMQGSPASGWNANTFPFPPQKGQPGGPPGGRPNAEVMQARGPGPGFAMPKSSGPLGKGMPPEQIPGGKGGYPPQAQQRSQMPDQRAPMAQPPAAKSTGLSLERAAHMTPGGAQMPKAPGMQANMGQAARQAPDAHQMQPGPIAPSQTVPKSSIPMPKPGPIQEGRHGAQWRALRSEKFSDIIVRESMEVGSKTIRRMQPGEFCTQRGSAQLLESGLVRMQIEPDGGWVTVHARNIQGPTFLEEALEARPPAAQDIRLRQQVAPSMSMPKAAPRQASPQPSADTRASATAARDRAIAATNKARGEDDRKLGPRDNAKASAPDAKSQAMAKSKAPAPAASTAPWQDDFDPWAKAANYDPWAKAADPWAAAANKQRPAAQVPKAASKAPPASTSQSTRPTGQQWGSNYSSQPPASTSYQKMELLRLREKLLNGKPKGPPPSSMATFRTLRIPDMGSTDRRVKRSERDRDRDRDRERRGDRKTAADGDDDHGSGSTAFLRDRASNTAARDSPLREAPRAEANTDSQQRTGQPAPKARAASNAPSPSDATTTTATKTVDTKDEKKPKEETKANCPTQ